MLPARSRLRASADFQSAMRRGTRAGRRTLVVHIALTGDAERMAGFAVSKAVGGAVVRNRVKRRLRALMADRIDHLPAGSRVVVRALPDAADAEFSTLARELDDALGSAVRKASR
ncbi:ribonuclease P protein component [Demequina sp. SYSU T00039]|uniref:Ribonuclease P protein component n=1 Tax=Demequina lignilytica TaxID=3051663 RepID=A0AAW7M4M1_9MICO|nr:MULTISPECIES: ribonuclease P protein component [unclassified Demequina]MDN4477809.1 ribonuclease P protein component [Demequina sp. SYSU T00039-1]MDN4487718.1 ribonuclease P protein component [Demequina sp. SYSU T00039]MDN4490899.1 ribonuclease P protein component [Demequina sp. SYSU T00068]